MKTGKIKNLTFKLFVLSVLFVLPVFLAPCGGGGNDDDEAPDSVDPGINVDPDGDLASYIENTFSENGIAISVDPTSIDFGTTNQDEKLQQSFTLTNGTSTSYTFDIAIGGTTGTYRFISTDSDENTVYSATTNDLTLEAGDSQEFTIEFDASLMGTKTGYVRIEDQSSDNYITLPFTSSVTGPADFQVIAASYFCSDEEAPQLTELDFMRVASGKTETQYFKICNTGGEDIEISSITFSTSTSGAESEVFSIDPFTDFAWEVEDTLTSALFEYYNPSNEETFSEPEYVTYDSTSPDEPAAFSAIEASTESEIENLLIESGDYVKVGVEFSPIITSEVPEGSLYYPIPYAAKMIINSSLGKVNVDTLGATGGKEPVLEASFTIEDSSLDYDLDLTSDGASINFGTVDIFEDWITEDSSLITLTLKNNGSGTKNLKVWLDPITAGYFSLVEESPAQTFPLEIAVDKTKTIQLRYSPTPTDGQAIDTYDLGQLAINHNGGNGPSHGITLLGEQSGSEAVQIYRESSKLKTTYTPENPKSFCVFKIGEGSKNSFTIKNNSTVDSNNLTTKWSISELSGVRASVSSGTVTTKPGKESTLSIRFTPSSGAVEGDLLTGKMSFQNSYALEDEYGVSLEDYEVYFKATASTTGECTGGDGSPITGETTLVGARMTMILPGATLARNTPGWNVQFKINFDLENGYAWMGPLEYDPTTSDPASVNVLKFHNHQGTNIQACYPYPSIPYLNENEAGNFLTKANCPYTDNGFAITGSEVCMTPKTFEPVTQNNQNYSVGHHYAVKMDPDTCEPEFEAKIATMALKTGETLEDKFEEMVEKYGDSGDEDDYSGLTGTYQFDSYITFFKAYKSGSCDAAAGETIENDADAVKACWEAIRDDTTQSFTRSYGMVESCAWWYFKVLDEDVGCVPQDAPGAENHPDDLCEDSSITWNDPDTWQAFGLYEPYVDPNTREESESKMDFTLNNIHLPGPFPVHSLNSFYTHAAKLMYADLYITMTTKAILTDELIATVIRGDFTEEDMEIGINSTTAKNYYTEDGLNSAFVAGGDDDVSCFDEDTGAPKTNTACRGNYLIPVSDHLVPAGEPIDFNNKMRLILVGRSSFRGAYSTGEMSPTFTSSNSDGTGRPMLMTLVGCLNTDEEVSPDAGCYDDYWDDQEYMDAYYNEGMITSNDQDETTGDLNALINFKIYDSDRDRYTNYYDYPSYLSFDNKYITDQCAYGN